MIKKPPDAKSKSVLKYQRYTVHYCIAFIILCVVCYIYVQTTTLQRKTIEYSAWTFNQFVKSKLINNSTVQTPRARKLVLLWTDYFSQSNWLPSTDELRCPVQECEITSNRSRLSNSSAVVLHWRNIDPADLPPECSYSSKGSHPKDCPIYVLFNKEAPPHTNADKIRKLNNKIHLVASYRKDSKIYAPYGKIVRRSGSYKMPELEPNRTTVCWLVSHCQTQSNREVYVNNLKRYVDVKVYGKCGNHSCPHAHAIDCYKWLSKRCKFYLSFENSICKDYSTEKLYYAMMTDMVPIVMGGDDYSRYLPSYSFINVADFSSPEVLGRYLKALDQDEDSYLAYFKWKERFKAEFVPYEWLCDLCAWLHSASLKDLKPRENVISWWFSEAHCGYS